ncbi:DUF3800 domain-containing protein [Streptococcus rifensis]
MKHYIFFDESKKIDRESEYSYYGAISIEESELSKIEEEIEKLLINLGRKSELHFVDYQGADLKKYFQVLDFFLSCSSIKFNIYRLNNTHYFKLGDALGYSDSELRKYFYVKIPERLFYGLVRDDSQIDGLEIIMDDSTEFQTLGVFEKLIDQMNAHSLYRGKNYHVESIGGINSQNSRMIQMLDVILGIVVYLLEYEHLGDQSNTNLNKQDFIYRLLCEGDNLHRFHQIISIYTWESEKIDSVSRMEISAFTSQFLAKCNQNEFSHMTAVQQVYLNNREYLATLSPDDRHSRINLLKQSLQNPYSDDRKLTNTLVELFLGYLSQIEFKDRNKFLR